jgi:hypothetical protein
MNIYVGIDAAYSPAEDVEELVKKLNHALIFLLLAAP